MPHDCRSLCLRCAQRALGAFLPADLYDARRIPRKPAQGLHQNSQSLRGLDARTFHAVLRALGRGAGFLHPCNGRACRHRIHPCPFHRQVRRSIHRFRYLQSRAQCAQIPRHHAFTPGRRCYRYGADGRCRPGAFRARYRIPGCDRCTVRNARI